MSVDLPKVRILVIGDSGVGKSSLVHLLCHETVLENPRWTVGCEPEVKLYHYQQRNKDYFVEFWDMGGSKKYESSREMFFSQINGILLVFDVTNGKSYANLRPWIRQVVAADKRKPIEESYVYTGGDLLPGSHSPSISRLHHRGGESRSPSPHMSGLGLRESSKVAPSHRPRHSASLGSLPVLVVGNKVDLLEDSTARQYNTLKEYGLESVYVSAVHPAKYVDKLNDFIDRVIERRFYRSDDVGHRTLMSPVGPFVYSRRDVAPPVSLPPSAYPSSDGTGDPEALPPVGDRRPQVERSLQQQYHHHPPSVPPLQQQQQQPVSNGVGLFPLRGSGAVGPGQASYPSSGAFSARTPSAALFSGPGNGASSSSAAPAGGGAVNPVGPYGYPGGSVPR